MRTSLKRPWQRILAMVLCMASDLLKANPVNLAERDRIVVLFTDGIPNLNDGSASGSGSDVTDNVVGKSPAIQDYANFGPNNELYLAPGQGISFTLAGQEGIENVQNVHLALKSVGGTSQVVIYGIKVNMKPNGGYTTETIFVKGGESSYMEVKSATDLYYDITKVKDCYAIVIYNPNNPANGATHSILSVTNLKLTHAQNPETRGTVQPMVSRGMAEVALMALKPAPVNPFADVREGAYYYDGVVWAVRKGITSGTDERHFDPAGSCNRAQVVTFLWRAAGSPEPGVTGHPFTDVQTGSFYEKAVLWAVENGITKGVAADSFAPSLTCTRGQVVTFLYCAYTK